jgi:hypothetical protein
VHIGNAQSGDVTVLIEDNEHGHKIRIVWKSIEGIRYDLQLIAEPESMTFQIQIDLLGRTGLLMKERSHFLDELRSVFVTQVFQFCSPPKN